MKKILFNILMLAGMAFLYSSCSNSAYDADNFYPSKYHKIMLLKQYGKQTYDLATVQTDYQDTMVVYKAGSNPGLTADVNFQVLDQATIDAQYNEVEGMDYRVVPQEDYEFNSGSEVKFESGETGKNFVMTIHADKVYAFMQNSQNVTSKTKFVLPVKMTSANDTINSDMGYSFKILNVQQPLISLPGNSYNAFTYETVDLNVSAKVTNFTNDRDFTCSLVNDPAVIDSLFQIYKNGHAGYDCALMPAANYTMPTIQFTKGNNTGTAVLSIKRDGLTNEKHYVIPFMLSSTTLPKAALNTKVQFIIVTPPTVAYETPARSNWKILFCNNDLKFWTGGSGNDNSGAGALIDGNVSTYWHCNYYGCWPADYQGQDQTGKNKGHAAGDDYCYYFKDYHAFAAKRYANQTCIVIDMGESMPIIGTGFQQRQNSAYDTKSFDVYVSDDATFDFKPLESGGSLSDYNNPSLNKWTLVCSTNAAKQNAITWSQMDNASILAGGVKGRYLKICFTGTNRGQILAGAEFYVVHLLSINGKAVK